ncbi:MAG: TIGR03915 family putative DNA repair protein [Coriobacteriia bacterium]|nr:TIGR03915 family putative DNA repair protein [Coriobacteriia bacterium]
MLIYTYDNTLEGFLSCVFEAYGAGEHPEEICQLQGMQYRIGQELKAIDTCVDKWRRVRAGIHRKLGGLAWEKIRACYCASTPGKEMLLYRYLRAGFDRGRVALDDISHPDILPVEDLYRSVGMEQQRMIMFARFAKVSLPGSEPVYCCTINPKHNVLPLIMSHFSGRFNVQPFIIYDEVHQVAGASQSGQWQLHQVEEGAFAGFGQADADDKEWQALWKTFYDAIAIPERRNDKRRQGFMPQRLWKHLPEMQLSKN